MSKTSLALNNLRGFAVIIVVAFHSCIAYVQNQPAAAVPFDEPYRWAANPIVDADRWLGFDLFCAFAFLFMMQLMFFLSGLFVWPSLMRKGAGAFLLDRILRIGVPFLIGTFVLMPLTYFAVYRVTAADPSFAAFWARWIALPFWASGPMWFLWSLLMLNIGAVLLFRLAPRSIELLIGLLGTKSKAAAVRFFTILVAATALAYVPLAALYTPWQWVEFGPFSVQPVLAPQYLIYFLAGIAVGAHGLDTGLLSADGMLARRWPAWVAGCVASFALWIAFTALTFKGNASFGVQLIANVALVLYAATACLSFAALFLRFAARRWPRFEKLGDFGYGIYLFHYLFVIWTQYLLLGVSLPALVKGAIVFAVTLSLSFAATALLCRIPGGERLIRGQRRIAMERGTA
jgi:peptidoglycan/LPS O-acetylase OafA/YrhL